MRGLKSCHPDLRNSGDSLPSPIHNHSCLLRYPAKTLPEWIWILCGLIKPQVRHLVSWDQNPKEKAPPCECHLHAYLRHKHFVNPINSLLPGGARTLCHSLRPQMNIPGPLLARCAEYVGNRQEQERSLVWSRPWHSSTEIQDGPGNRTYLTFNPIPTLFAMGQRINHENSLKLAFFIWYLIKEMLTARVSTGWGLKWIKP